jgi:hypothetical protein
MKTADYKCSKFGVVFEITVKDYEDFPKTALCPVCHEVSKRVFSPAFPIIHRGKCGNSKNGYESSPVKIKKS